MSDLVTKSADFLTDNKQAIEDGQWFRIDELKKETLKSYISKASDDAADMSRRGGSMAGVSKLGYEHPTSKERLGSAKKRLTGIKNALKRL